ncbi:glycosyltransferase [Candidatus Omnitrophota bacterium]
MRTLVCLPTKNEKESIQMMIDKIKQLNLDLIICDEQSNDGTVEIASKNSVSVYQRVGKGKGYGIIKALGVARELNYDFLVLIDCDNSYPSEYIPELLSFLPEYDMVVGARRMGGIQFSHRIVNILHTGLINLLFMARLKDINSGLRVLRVDKLVELIDAKGFDIEAQITVKGLKNKLKIKEIPIDYKKRDGKSKIRAWDTFVILRTILKERFLLKR